MPDHLRQQIRDAAAALITGLASTGTRVEIGKTYPLAAQHSPTWLVYTRREISDVATSGAAPELERTVNLLLEGRTDTAGPPDDLLDTMALEAETALGAGQKLGGLAKELTLIETDVEVIAAGDRHLGRIQLRFRVAYWTAEGAPGAAV